MRLSRIEFLAMNNPIRRFIQRRVEFKNFQEMGLVDPDRDILEIGCGSGFGAVLLADLRPRSYVGIDLMPEQIKLAERKSLAGYRFLVMDATDLKIFPDRSKDYVVVFGILHHMPEWRMALKEIYRVLRPGGKLFIEEPDGIMLKKFDRIFHWGHPKEAGFTLDEFEMEIIENGFAITSRKYLLSFGIYCAEK